MRRTYNPVRRVRARPEGPNPSGPAQVDIVQEIRLVWDRELGENYVTSDTTYSIITSVSSSDVSDA